MNALGSIRTRQAETGTIALSGVPAVVLPDVVNLLYERLCADVFGEAAGRRKAIESAADATREMLDAIFERSAIERARRLSLARMVFTACGEGKFGIDTDGARRFAWATSTLNPTASKHLDASVEPDGDGYAAGFIGAAVEAGLDRPPGSIVAREFRCIGRGDARCEIEFVVRETRDESPPFNVASSMAGLDERVAGEDEESVGVLSRQLTAYLDAQPVDAEGTISVFAARVSMRPASWFGRVYCAAHAELAAEAGLAAERVDDIVREAGRLWVERLCLSAMASDEWEIFVGGPPTSGHALITQCTALARACGLGRWAMRDHTPGHRLAIRSPWLAEAGWVRSRCARTVTGTAFLEGAAGALLALASAVDEGLDVLETGRAIEAIRSRARRVTIAEVVSIAFGAPHCEVAVTLS